MNNICRIILAITPIVIGFFLLYKLFYWYHKEGYKKAVSEIAKIKKDIEREMEK